MIDERFIILSAIINTIGGLQYLRDTIKGKTKPNKVSWLIWMIAPFIAFFAQLEKGVGLLSLMTFSAGFCPLMVLTASFFNKKAAWKLTRFDIGCGLLSCAGLVLWVLTKEGNFAIFFGVLADGFATLPTLVKSYKHPETETPTAFLFGVFAGIITLFTIKTWTFAHYGFAVYLCLANAAIYSVGTFRLRFLKNKS